MQLKLYFMCTISTEISYVNTINIPLCFSDIFFFRMAFKHLIILCETSSLEQALIQGITSTETAGPGF